MSVFKDFFHKTTKKVDTAIDEVVDDTKKVMSNANELMDISKDKIKIATYVMCGGFLLSIVTNLVTIYCCSQVVKSVHRNDVLLEIEKIMRNKK